MAAVYDKVLGTLLIGSWVNALLAPFIVVSSIKYFKLFPNDSFIYKAMVYTCIVFNIACCIAEFSSVYLYVVTHWGDVPYLANQYWPFMMFCFVSWPGALIVEGYLIYRYWRLSSNIVITIVLVLAVLTGTAGTILSGIYVSKYSRYEDREKLTTPVTMWFVSNAGADVLITLALCIKLWTMKSNFKQTDKVIHRLIGGAMTTGCAPAILAACTVIFFLSMPQSNAHATALYPLGSVYTLTLLYNLNNRHSQKNENSHGSGPSRSMTGARMESTAMETMGGVQVHRVVRMDHPKEGTKFNDDGDSYNNELSTKSIV
ncbi:hypothetical protein DL96DRAFT_1706842 [Flagelloscypha sp. PMI_526]|nr:hypothetical protein DL96DRAFT_1706842 [Flagelloscypha sp. PMI_526]